MNELYTGTIRKMKVPYKMACEPCEGTGCTSKKTPQCSRCKGNGFMVQHRQVGPGMVQQVRRPCPECRGSGEVVDPKDRCTVCQGRKWKQAHRDIEFTIYPGMEWGMKMVLGEKGDELRDQITGDLIIALIPDGTDARSAMTEPKYELRNGDLIYELSIDLVSALAGFKYRLRHPGTGKWLSIDYPDIIHPDQVYVIKGQGMPRPDRQAIQRQVPLKSVTPKYGDLIIHFKVNFPKKITIPQKQILRKMFPPSSTASSDNDVSVTMVPGPKHHYRDGSDEDDEFGPRGPSGPGPEGVQCAQQ